MSSSLTTKNSIGAQKTQESDETKLNQSFSLAISPLPKTTLFLQAALSDAPEHERLAAERDLDARFGEVMSMLLSAATFGGGDGENEGDEFDAAATAAVVAAAANASVPADAELAALQAEVDARAARVAALRAAAPRALRAALMQRLAADDDKAARKAEKSAEKPRDGESEGNKDGGGDDDDPPPPAPLGASFAATLGAMPGLRARVEEAADRLERAVEAMEAEASAPASGMTADLYYPLTESGRNKQGAGGDLDAATTDEEEGGAAARALAAHARACLPR